MMRTRRHRQLNKQPVGFTIIEATISVAIVGVMFISAINMAGTSKLSRYRRALNDRATMLAESLLTEVLALPYEDPDEATTALGQNPSDAAVHAALVAGDVDGNTVRRDWCDDVDDLDGYTQSPPVNYDGSAMAGLDGWTRSVTVIWVDPANLNTESSTETGVKAVNVTVSFGNQIEVAVKGLRSSGR